MERATGRLAALALSLLAALTIAADVPARVPGTAAAPLRPALQDGASAEARTARYFESIRGEPLLLAAFLRAMPKGGDLHIHPSGAEYAESYIAYAAEDGLCVLRATLMLTAPPCDPAAGSIPAAAGLTDVELRSAMINAWSMRAFVPGQESGHDHFFATFGLFNAAWSRRTGDVLADVIARAAAQNVIYLELMYGLDRGAARTLVDRVGWDEDLGRLRGRLLAEGMASVVAEARQALDAAEARVGERLGCGTPAADPGCHVEVRFLQTGTRTDRPERVFAQLVAGFELARADPRVVGVNLVAPEDDYVALRDYRLHMAMLAYLHGVAPEVNISLHAGELVPGLVPPEDLRFHIREAVERGHARRIGHGVSVMYEDDPFGLLAEMARRNVLVEILLTSNAQILNVEGPHQAFQIYRRFGVPVTLATDDEGVSRSDLTLEYQRAVEGYDLSYADVKVLARNSLEYAFVPGESLWAGLGQLAPVAACATGPLGTAPSAECEAVLARSERARLQWRLEAAFAAFESGY